MSSSVYVVKAIHTPLADDAVGILDRLIADAAQAHASDIHIQPTAALTAVRLRINGVLRTHEVYEHTVAAAVISRLKVLCSLDIAQQRLPQDGALRVQVAGRDYDVRISLFPTIYGQKAVLRLLHQAPLHRQLAALRLPEDMVTQLRAVTQHQQGFFITTGPTGAGKTTTLYAMINEIDRDTRNVVTLEDPVEYRIQGVTQTPIQPAIDFTFAAAMRCLLRQDPDVALIGEMRDEQTARSAIEAALTGHLVLSSLHTTHASAVPIRLRDMGVPPYLIASSLTGVLAQRLLPVLCRSCRQEAPISTAAQLWLEHKGARLAQAYEAPGCASCHHTGVQGRQMVAEWWPLSDQARLLINAADSTAMALHEQACADGMVPLATAGISLAEQGIVALSALIGL